MKGSHRKTVLTMGPQNKKFEKLCFTVKNSLQVRIFATVVDLTETWWSSE